jgi:hypothetical protein
MVPSWDAIKGFIDTPTLLIACAVALFFAAYAPRGARIVIIWVAQFAAFLALVLGAAVAGRAGYAAGLTSAQAQHVNDVGQLYYAAAGAAIGGVLGLVVGALAVSVLFVLLDIRENTRG